MKKGYDFIEEQLQHHRKKPKKFKHFIKLNMSLFDELVEKGIISPVDWFCDETAYFEFTELDVTVSFIMYWHVEDAHVRILDYLVRQAYGKNPVERGAYSGV